MNNILIESEFDYADEFGVRGFWITTQTELNRMFKELQKYIDVNGSWECYFGTNEYIYITSVEDYKSGLSITQLNDDEYNTLRNIFGSKYTYIDGISYGTPIIFK